MQNPVSTLVPGISASVPQEHNLGQPCFLGGVIFPGWFLTGELSQKGHTHLTDMEYLYPRCVPIGS